jgi:hypothetical protein
MRVFLLDLWLDLRAKRLAPVALALLAAIIAVPIVLAKGNDETPPPAPTTTAPTATTAGTVVESQTQAKPADSRLQTFSARDPFEPTKVIAVATTGSSSSGSTGTGTDASTGTSSTGTTENAATPGTSGGGTTGTDTGSTGTGSTGTTTTETKTTLFTYTVGLKFGPGGDVKTYADVKRLELIPDQENPKAVFLGVTTTGKTAVFLIDANLGVDTDEGRCRPSADECTFLYLRPDKDHDQALLTDSDGTVYHMRLLDINRVSVSSANGNNTSGNGNSGNPKSKRSPAFTGSAQSTDGTQPGETPPGEPDQRSSFQQFFADSGR